MRAARPRAERRPAVARPGGGRAHPAGRDALPGDARVHGVARRAAADRRRALLGRWHDALRGGRGGHERERALSHHRDAERRAAGDRARCAGQGLRRRQSRRRQRAGRRTRRGPRVRPVGHLLLHLLPHQLHRRASRRRRRHGEDGEPPGAPVGGGPHLRRRPHRSRDGRRLSPRQHRCRRQRVRGAARREHSDGNLRTESVVADHASREGVPRRATACRRSGRRRHAVRACRHVRR
jgi:hypothetical protein